MKYKESMATDDKYYRYLAVDEELKKMWKYYVWTPQKLQDLPPDEKRISSSWSTKKTNVTYRGRLNERGYKQVEGILSYASPVTNDTRIHIVVVLTLMSLWIAKILDV